MSHDHIAKGQDGLFATERIPKNFEIMYFGRYYDSGAAVDEAELDDDRYVFNKANHHFDGMATPDQLRSSSPTDSAPPQCKADVLHCGGWSPPRI